MQAGEWVCTFKEGMPSLSTFTVSQTFFPASIDIFSLKVSWDRSPKSSASHCSSVMVMNPGDDTVSLWNSASLSRAESIISGNVGTNSDSDLL